MIDHFIFLCLQAIALDRNLLHTVARSCCVTTIFFITALHRVFASCAQAPSRYLEVTAEVTATAASCGRPEPGAWGKLLKGGIPCVLN
jgi:hypothetical protein